MKRLISALLAASIAALLCAAPASASFGFEDFEVAFTNADGSPATQAGSHPFAMTTAFHVNTVEDPKLGKIPDGAFKDLIVDLPPGLVADPAATPYCTGVEFLDIILEESMPACSNSSALGVAVVETRAGTRGVPVFNLVPPPGVAAKLGFVFLNVPVTIEGGVNPDPPYQLFAASTDTAQVVNFFSAELTLWGKPFESVHDPLRGNCLDAVTELEVSGGEPISKGNCPANIAKKPFFTMPRSCTGPLTTTAEAFAWQDPSVPVKVKSTTPLGMSGCSKVGFAPKISTQPTTDQAESPSGLDVGVDIDDEGLGNPSGIALSDIKKARVTLPVGMTVNPSQAEGLLTCSPSEYAREEIDTEPGEGCPEASKIGTVRADTPLLEEAHPLEGALYVAQQDDPSTATPGAENPFDSLIALYMVFRNEELGVIVKLAVKVEPDPVTGQLIGTVFEAPQLPVSHFKLHFREGGRSPLITPPVCGDYQTKAEFTPWSDPTKVLTTTSSFKVLSGVGGSSCPTGPQPFRPGFQAGSLNNNAGSYSPFYMRLMRSDGDQDLTKLSAKLPPGMVAKLAGTSQCPDAAIAAARSKRGRAELSSPSCPPSSQIGRVMAGAGVGSQLTYVPGKLYLAGPYKGAPLSVAAIVPAVAGPFDVGTVLTRVALRIDPRSAEVEADGASSDPIPHILAGIPLKVRDIRVYVDRPDFTLNPTSCDPFSIDARIWGGGADVFSPADDSPLSLEDRFQAANCEALGFKPRLSLKLKGGTKRGAHPALTGTYRPRPGDANLANLVLRLPRSAFLDQAHIRTICTRVQFAAKSCPAGAIYGQATAYTPILDEPLTGPVYLRSSNHNLPDFVADLHGLVDVEAVARIDSKQGGIRASFEDVPDAPLTKVVVQMQGAKKGLIVNSRNLCGAKSKANAEFVGQNGKEYKTKPVVGASCGGKGKRQGPHP
jgi:hypothetical protein